MARRRKALHSSLSSLSLSLSVEEIRRVKPRFLIDIFPFRWNFVNTLDSLADLHFYVQQREEIHEQQGEKEETISLRYFDTRLRDLNEKSVTEKGNVGVH